MKGTKTTLIVMAVLIHYFLLMLIGGWVVVLNGDVNRWEKHKLEQSVKFNNIWASYLQGK